MALVLKPNKVRCDQKVSGNLFHSTCVTMAKLCRLIGLSGFIEDTDTLKIKHTFSKNVILKWRFNHLMENNEINVYFGILKRITVKAYMHQ